MIDIRNEIENALKHTDEDYIHANLLIQSVIDNKQDVFDSVLSQKNSRNILLDIVGYYLSELLWQFLLNKKIENDYDDYDFDFQWKVFNFYDSDLSLNSEQKEFLDYNDFKDYSNYFGYIFSDEEYNNRGWVLGKLLEYLKNEGITFEDYFKVQLNSISQSDFIGFNNLLESKNISISLELNNKINLRLNKQKKVFIKNAKTQLSKIKNSYDLSNFFEEANNLKVLDSDMLYTLFKTKKLQKLLVSWFYKNDLLTNELYERQDSDFNKEKLCALFTETIISNAEDSDIKNLVLELFLFIFKLPKREIIHLYNTSLINILGPNLAIFNLKVDNFWLTQKCIGQVQFLGIYGECEMLEKRRNLYSHLSDNNLIFMSIVYDILYSEKFSSFLTSNTTLTKQINLTLVSSLERSEENIALEKYYIDNSLLIDFILYFDLQKCLVLETIIYIKRFYSNFFLFTLTNDLSFSRPNDSKTRYYYSSAVLNDVLSGGFQQDFISNKTFEDRKIDYESIACNLIKKHNFKIEHLNKSIKVSEFLNNEGFIDKKTKDRIDGFSNIRIIVKKFFS